MTTEEMRRAWEETSRRLETLERNYGAMRAGINDGKRQTALDSLASRYRRFSILGLIMVMVSPFYAFNHIFSGKLQIWIPVAMALYFGIASVMDWWLYKKVKSIDVATMPSERVVALAALYRRRHFQFMAILIPMMLVIVALFLLGSWDNIYMVYGIIFGLVIGLVLGIRQLINFLDDYRMLKESV